MDLQKEISTLADELDAVDSSTPEGQWEMAVLLTQKLQEIHGNKARQVFFRDPKLIAAGYGRYSNVVCDLGSEHAEEGLMLTGHYDTVKRGQYDALKRKTKKITRKYDMLGSVAASVIASKYLTLPPKRRVRLLFVPDEEIFSAGTEDALYSDSRHRSLYEGINCVVSGEIPVGAKEGDPPAVYIGRPGRVVLNLEVNGLRVHAGEANDEDYDKYTFPRLERAYKKVWRMQFPPNARPSLLPATRAKLTEGDFKDEGNAGMTMPGRGRVAIEVHNSNYNLTPEAILELVRAQVREALGDEDFSLELLKRPTRCAPPYEEDPQSPFAQNALHIARQHTYRESGLWEKITFDVGQATADEGRSGLPTVFFPPLGRDEHKSSECLQEETLVEVANFQIAMAEHKGSLLQA
jgi:acetylornithine deacetylase/succinyl-diaminopimelate desuccinylase-like protein